MRKKHPFIKKSDKIIVLAGKERGKIGTVLKVDQEKGRVLVEKINIVKRHTKQGQGGTQGGLIEKEAPIHISNVMLVCPKCAEPSKIGNRRLEDGSKVRTCKKCDQFFDG